jgi:hypothetical protein
MEYLAKTISKNGGIAAVTIQEGADRLRELEAELVAAQAECLEQARLLGISGSREASLIARAEKAEAEVERLIARLYKGCDDERDMAISEGPGHDVCGLASELTTRAEKAEAELAKVLTQLQIITDFAANPNVQELAQVRAELTAMQVRAEKAEAASLEQARLLGMSASREASLLSKISQLEQQLEKNNS